VVVRFEKVNYNGFSGSEGGINTNNFSESRAREGLIARSRACILTAALPQVGAVAGSTRRRRSPRQWLP
jgi:hypothetical protein